MSQAKQKGNYSSRVDAAIKSSISKVLAEAKGVFEEYYKDFPENFSKIDDDSSGCVVAFDVKDGIEIGNKQKNWIYDGLPKPKALLNLVENELKDTLQEDKDFLNDFDSEMYIEGLSQNYMFFRYIGNLNFRSKEDALQDIQSFSFWSPQLIMLNGTWHNTYDMGAIDDDGNTVGIRF